MMIPYEMKNSDIVVYSKTDNTYTAYYMGKGNVNSNKLTQKDIVKNDDGSLKEVKYSYYIDQNGVRQSQDSIGKDVNTSGQTLLFIDGKLVKYDNGSWVQIQVKVGNEWKPVQYVGKYQVGILEDQKYVLVKIEGATNGIGYSVIGNRYANDQLFYLDGARFFSTKNGNNKIEFATRRNLDGSKREFREFDWKFTNIKYTEVNNTEVSKNLSEEWKHFFSLLFSNARI